MNTIELIKTIARRPAMYVDPESTVSIYFYVQGFYLCRSLHGLRDEQDDLFRDHFYGWLKETHGLDSAPTWGDLIAAIVARDQERPVVVFLREFERFLKACQK